MTRLASFWPVLVIANYPIPLKHKQSIISCYIPEGKKKNLPRAQTTQDASFGPVIVAAAFHWPLRAIIVPVVDINII